jgi:hypothetical protein
VDAAESRACVAAEEEARLDALARCLEAAAEQIDRLDEAAARLERQTEMRETIPDAIQAPVTEAEGGLPAEETVTSIELLSELAHMANGQSARLGSLITRAETAVLTLADAASRAAARDDSQGATGSGPVGAVPGTVVALQDATAEAVQQAIGAINDLQAGADRAVARIEAAGVAMNEAATRLGQVSLTALDGTIDMRNETRRFSSQATAAQAVFLAAAREAEQALHVAGEHLARQVSSEQENPRASGHSPHDMELLRNAIETAQVAAMRLQQSASNQEQALSRANTAALEITRLSQCRAEENAVDPAGVLDCAAGG